MRRLELSSASRSIRLLVCFLTGILIGLIAPYAYAYNFLGVIIFILLVPSLILLPFWIYNSIPRETRNDSWRTIRYLLAYIASLFLGAILGWISMPQSVQEDLEKRSVQQEINNDMALEEAKNAKQRLELESQTNMPTRNGSDNRSNVVVFEPGLAEAVNAACRYKKSSGATPKQSAAFAYMAIFSAMGNDSDGSLENWRIANNTDLLVAASQLNKFIDWIADQDANGKTAASDRLVSAINQQCP